MAAAPVRQVEVNYPRDDIGKEGSVISKSQGIRHFQKLNPDLVIVSVNKFKMNWETVEIECAFTVRDKYLSTVSQEKFLEIMETNSNLLRDLEKAKETNNMLVDEIAESEKQLLGYQKRIEVLEDMWKEDSYEDCSEKLRAECIEAHEKSKIDDPKPGDTKIDEQGRKLTYVKLVEPETAIVKHDQKFADLQKALEISSIEAASPVEEKTITDSEDTDGK